MNHETDKYPELDVIAVGAHPDDVEIACGGTLAQLAQQGYKVGIVDLTDGEPTPGCDTPAIRREEARQAAKTLGIHTRVILDLPNRRLFDSFEARCALAIEFRRYRPKIVIGFGGKTPMASPDHWQAMQITDAAVFYSRLTKWPEHFEGLPVHKVEAQLYFRLAFEPPTDSPAGQFVVDIGDTLSVKMKSVRCYATQFPPEKAHIFDRVQAAAEHTGLTAGFAAGEAFISPRPVGSRDLVKTVLLKR